jgi:hypothetical protein
MPLGTPKKRVLSEKVFSFEFKEKWRARDMQSRRQQASIGCCGTSFSITELILSGKMPLGTPKKRVKSNKSLACALTCCAHGQWLAEQIYWWLEVLYSYADHLGGLKASPNALQY